MKIENEKISNRQIFRLYVFDLMGIATLLLPPYLSRLCGIDGVFSILIGTGVGFLYLYYLGWVMKKIGMPITDYLRQNANRWIRNCVYLVVLLHSVVTAGFCAYVFSNLMQYSLVKETSYVVILISLLAGAAYAVSGGIENRARVYEVLFLFVLIPYIVMMLLSVKDFEMVYVTEVFQTKIIDVVKGAGLVFLFLTPLFFTIFLEGNKEKKYGLKIIKPVSAAIGFTGFLLLGSYILLVGNLGEESLATMRFPVVTLMSTIQFESNFLKRMDALMLAVWFFTLYALLNLHLHYGVRCFAEVANNKKWMSSNWNVVLLAGVAFLVAYGLHLSEMGMALFLRYYCYIAVPLMLLLPGLLLVFRRKRE